MSSPLPDAAAKALCAEIAVRRGPGTICEIVAGGTGLAERDGADAITGYCGLAMLGDGWKEIDRATAVAITIAVLSRDLAYDAHMMDAATARDYTDRFLGMFDDARYYTNGDLAWNHAHGGGSAGWSPITSATFDTGVIAVSDLLLGIVWVADED